MGARLLRRPPREASLPRRHRLLEGRHVHHPDRVQRAAELFRDSDEPDAVPDQGSPGGDEGRRQECQLLGQRHHAHALARRLPRRRLPRQVLHRSLLHRRLPPGPDGTGHGAAGATPEAGALAASARDALLRGHLPRVRGHGRSQAGAGELRGGPVRREPRVGARPEDVLLQLVELRALLRRLPRRHRRRLRAGPRRMGRRQRHAGGGHGRLPHRLPRRMEILPVQGARGQPAHAAAPGRRRRRQEEEPPAPRRRRRAPRGQAAEYQEEAALPHPPAPVPGQGGHSGARRRRGRGGAVAAGDGDAGGGDEAGAVHGAHLGRHAGLRHAGGAGVDLLHQARQRDGPSDGPALRAPSVVHLRTLRRGHDRHRRRLRQGARPVPAPRHGRGARDQHPPPRRHRHGVRHRRHGRGGRRRAPPPHVPLAGVHVGVVARAAVRAHGRRRRVRARRPPGVLLRPGPRQHAQPGNRAVPQRHGRWELPQQPRHHGGGLGELARRPRELVREGPQPQQARPLLLDAGVSWRRQPRVLLGRRHEVLVQGGQGRQGRRRRQVRRRRHRVRRRRVIASWRSLLAASH